MKLQKLPVRPTALGFALATLLAGSSIAFADDDAPAPALTRLQSASSLLAGSSQAAPSLTTLITTPRGIEGLTGDDGDNLYLAGSGAAPCPIWQVNRRAPALTVVGNVPAALATSCTLRGLAFDHQGHLFIADTTLGRIYVLSPNAAAPPEATLFATGVLGTNGIAFDRDDHLWTGDGSTGQGRIWKITGAGANCTGPNALVACQEILRVQPMRNSVALGGAIGGDGVGHQVRSFPPATSTIASGAFPVTPAGGQDLVANGLAFNRRGDLLVMDTARGALWKAEFDRRGALISPTGCDTTFTADTLCLGNIVVQHPLLEGGDGIAIDREENIWVDANERNAVIVVTRDGRVIEVFRNPVNAAGLRNAADPPLANNRILEFPTSPFLSRAFCTANSDADRRDNSPASAGEISGPAAGKVSCLDAPLSIPGLRLPVR